MAKSRQNLKLVTSRENRRFWKEGSRCIPKNQRELLDDAYREIFADASTVEQVKKAVMKILLRGDIAAVLLMKEMADRLEGTVVRSDYVH